MLFTISVFAPFAPVQRASGAMMPMQFHSQLPDTALHQHYQQGQEEEYYDYGEQASVMDSSEDRSRDKKALSLGLLVPDCIQFICAEGSALRWDEAGCFYEVDCCP